MTRPTKGGAGGMALVAAPAIVAAAALVAMEIARVVNPDAELFGGPRPVSLAAAIVEGFPVEVVYTFVHAGADPNGLVAVRRESFTGGEAVEVSPLVLAVAARHENVVRMLLEFGAKPDLPQNRLAWCLATELEARVIAEILANAATPGTRTSCPMLLDTPQSPPLRSFAQRADSETTAR